MAKSNFDRNKHTISNRKKRNKRITALALAAIMGLSGTGIYYLSQNVDISDYISQESFDEGLKRLDESFESLNEDLENSNENLESSSEPENEYTYMKTEEAEDIYELAVSDIAELLDDMDFDNDIQYFYAFYLYYYDGLFSETNNIQHVDDAKYIDDINALGLDSIIDKDGNGVVRCNCRHKDSLFNDVLNKSNMGFEAYSTTCHLYKDNDTNEKINHQISVVNYNNDTKYYDITNGAIADNFKSQEMVVNTNNNKVFYKIMPEYTLRDKKVITKHNSDDNVQRIVELVNNDNKTISDEEIDEQGKIAYAKMVENQDLVDEFENKYYADVISKLPNIRAK